MKKKIIILGGAGFVGLNLISMIDTKKYDIILIDKDKSKLDMVAKINPAITFINEDLKEIDNNWARQFRGAYCVIQLQAQITSPRKEDYTINNVNSVENVIKVCGKYKIKNFIHISTASVASASRDNYSITKTEGEKIVRQSKMPYTVLRPPMIYGSFEIKHLGYLAKMLDYFHVLPFPGNGKYLRQPIYVRDLCAIIIKLIEMKPKNEVNNLIGKENIYFIDMLKEIIRAKRKKRLLLTLPIPIFLVMFKTYGLITGKRPYQESQLYALTAGDIFPAENWEEKFDIKHTKFKEGIKAYITSQHEEYARRMLK